MERTSLHPAGLVVRLSPFFQCMLYDSIVFSYTAKVHLSIARCKSKVPQGIFLNSYLQDIQSISILFHEDGQHYGEGQHAGATIAQEG